MNEGLHNTISKNSWNTCFSFNSFFVVCTDGVVIVLYKLSICVLFKLKLLVRDVVLRYLNFCHISLYWNCHAFTSSIYNICFILYIAFLAARLCDFLTELFVVCISSRTFELPWVPITDLLTFLISDVSNGNSNFRGRPTILPEGNITFADLISPSKLLGRSTIFPYFQHPW